MSPLETLLVLALGAGCGGGLWACAVGLVPPRPSLGQLLDRATTPSPPDPEDEAVAGWARRAAAPWRALGLPDPGVRDDLRLLDRPVTLHLARKTLFTVVGVLTPALATAGLALLGAGGGLVVPAVVALGLGVAGFVTPDVLVRAQARRLRAQFRHALSAYLDLTWITLAGGAGVDTAVRDAAAIGHGWAFTRLRTALEAARLTRTSPWVGLRRLGVEIGVGELTELAASVSLAGTEGARVRASLAAKASGLRTHQLTDAEAAAQSATERLSLPVTVLFLGFLIFIGYPALAQVLTGL